MQYTFNTNETMGQFIDDLRQLYEDNGLIAKFKPSASTPEQDEAVARVIEGADDHWMDKAISAISVLVRTGEGAFTTDDVWALLDQWAIPRPTEPRAMGGAIKTAQADKVIVATGNYIRSVRPENHGRPVMVWSRAW